MHEDTPFPCDDCPDRALCGNSGLCLDDDPLVVLPYLSPRDRTLGTLRREAVQAGILVALTLGGDLVAQLLIDTSLDNRTLILLIAAIGIKALAAVATKWDRTIRED